jgi:FAD/FMN-containing dehydrogenase
MTTFDWDRLLPELDGIAIERDPRRLRVKSRDYFWYSPVLDAELKDKLGEVVVSPVNEDEVRRVASFAARHRVPLTIRAGGTGNYGQSVPLKGGMILDVMGLNRVLEISPGRARVEAGCKLQAVEDAAQATGQAMLMWPSTKKIATIGGFIGGGYAGIGSLRHGILKDTGNVTRIRVMTVEETPRIIELRDADIQKVHHAYGTNGIMLDLDVALAPAVEWRHQIMSFPTYEDTLKFGQAASRPDMDVFLLTTVERRFKPFYRTLGDHFPDGRDCVFAMVAPGSSEAFHALAKTHGATRSLDMTEHEIEKAGLMPTYECAYNHTTLQALKVDRGWTYLQIAYPQPVDLALVNRQMARYGDELLMHHEFAKQFGDYAVFALPLVRWSTKERLYQVIREFEADGCLVFDPHVYTIEDGGMKEIDHAQIDFKKIADPHGVMNPGKTRGWPAA